MLVSDIGAEINLDQEEQDILSAFNEMLKAAKHAKKDAVTKKRMRKAFLDSTESVQTIILYQS